MGSASGFIGGLFANFGGISIKALVIRTATGLRSDPTAFMPSRCASSGIDPPPQNGSYIVGACSAKYCIISSFRRAGGGADSPGNGGLPGCRAMDLAISNRASASRSGSLEFSHLTSRLMIPWSRLRSIAWSSMVGNSSVHDDGSSTKLAKATARQTTSGRLAQY